MTSISGDDMTTDIIFAEIKHFQQTVIVILLLSILMYITIIKHFIKHLSSANIDEMCGCTMFFPLVMSAS